MNYVFQSLNRPRVNQTKFTNKGNQSFETRKCMDKSRVDHFCPGCFTVGKELKTSIVFRHSLSMCPRTKTVARFLQTDLESDNRDYSEEEDSDGMEENGNKSQIRTNSEMNSFQISPTHIPKTEIESASLSVVARSSNHKSF